MRGQLIPFAFFILVVFLIISGYIFFNTFYGSKYESDILNVRILNVVRNVIESFKSYLGVSLQYSSQQTLRESACLGGLLSKQQVWAWICGGSNPLPVDKSKECSEEFMKYYLNVYGSNFSISIPVDFSNNNFTKCVMGIDENGVFSGKYDNGSFWINCTNSSIVIHGDNMAAMEGLNISEFITHDRFWYMFRIITDWANENYYGKCICGATVACGGCNDVDNCANEALNELQQKFDSDVDCQRMISEKCCKQETGSCCSEPQACLSWPDACQAVCDLKCGEPSVSTPVCIPKGIGSTSSISGYGGETSSLYGVSNDFSELHLKRIFADSNESTKPTLYWCEWRLAGRDLYVCDDYRYTVPSPSGPIPLSFKIIAQASFRVPHPSCEQCVYPGCGGTEC